jgi:hypothetical protein
MPLVGISYQSEEKDDEYRRRFTDPKAIYDVVVAAIEMGVSKLASTTPDSSPLALRHLQVLKKIIDEG